MRIAIAGFSDETCTFCNEPTQIERFEPATLRGQSVLEGNRGIPTYINGYMRVLEAAGDVEIVPLVYASKTPGGFQSWLTPECFDKYADEIAERVSGAGKLDGLLLSLHGAMAVSGVSKPEAELVRRARAAAGDIPIMVTLDLHANEDHELTDAADGVFILKTYPHVDSQEIGEIAARCMVETVRGTFSPVQATRKPPIVSASIYQASEYPPMKLVYDRCRDWEQNRGVYCLSVAPGYAYADVPDIGMFVVAVTNGDRELAEAAAQDVADLVWDLREQFAEPLPKPKDGVAEVMDLVAGGQKPVVIADGADRIGDSTHVLKELLAQGARNWAIPGIADPAAAKHVEVNCQVGDKVTITVGGWYNYLSGEPVEITGIIEFMGRPSYVLVGPMRKGARVQDGFVARINLGDNRHVVVADRMRGSNDSAGLTSVGVDIGTLDIIILKDRVHHRAFWDSVAKVDYRMDAPGIGLADISLLKYENIPPDIFPVGAKWRK